MSLVALAVRFVRFSCHMMKSLPIIMVALLYKVADRMLLLHSATRSSPASQSHDTTMDNEKILSFSRLWSFKLFGKSGLQNLCNSSLYFLTGLRLERLDFFVHQLV